MTLIDSSSWIHALRKGGDACVRQRVLELMISGEAAWCDLVRVELWIGVKQKKEAAFLRGLEENIHMLSMTSAAWNAACDLGRQTRKKGTPVPTTDLCVFACARVHGARLEHSDRHFDALQLLT